MSKPLVSLIDGDIINYSVGFAAEGEPLSYALHSTKQMLNNIQEASGGDERIVFLTGKGNYRLDAAKCLPYKGNRKQDKPTHYQGIRDYLLEHQEAILIEGAEADDALGIAQCNPPEGKDTIICTLDKDLDMIAGMHYCWRGKREGVYHMDEVEADRNFYRQLIKGDSGDNIPGIFKYTGVKASKKLMLPLDSLTTPEEMYQHVHEVYHNAAKYKEIHDLGFPVTPDQFIEEIGKLLWIQRNEHQEWMPKVLDVSSDSLPSM